VNKRVRVFQSDEDAVAFIDRNCESCKNYTKDETPYLCDIVIAFWSAAYGDGKMPEVIASRMGYTPFEDWSCKERIEI
jgi:hypothetical protein